MQAASKLYEKFTVSHSFPLLEATIELAFIIFPFIEQPLLCSLLFSTELSGDPKYDRTREARRRKISHLYVSGL